jgi:hypothetical protein
VRTPPQAAALGQMKFSARRGRKEQLLAETPEWSALTAEASNLVAWLDRMNTRSSLKTTTWEHVSEMAKAA